LIVACETISVLKSTSPEDYYKIIFPNPWESRNICFHPCRKLITLASIPARFPSSRPHAGFSFVGVLTNGSSTLPSDNLSPGRATICHPARQHFVASVDETEGNHHVVFGVLCVMCFVRDVLNVINK